MFSIFYNVQQQFFLSVFFLFYFLFNFYCIESPRRYVETDVNIHYKTPVRFEYKDPVPEAELAYRQAEHMKKLYQEERRRKYLQELQDMSNRRHADYFTPSQKSPISLNRYDDFGADLSPTSPNSGSRTIARALYNFQGQTARFIYTIFECILYTYLPIGISEQKLI